MNELEHLKNFLESKSSEKAKDYLVFPIFQKLFGSKFKKESDAEGADIYVEGKLIVELKSDTDNFLSGFYQALHYEKKGLSFSSVCVIKHKYIGLWKIKDIPREALDFAKNSDPLKAPSEVGQINARKTHPSLRKKIQQASFFSIAPSDLEGFFESNIGSQLNEFVQVLKNLESDRIQIAPRNFISKIKLMEEYFDNPLEAIHCFYSIVGYWNATSRISENDETNEIVVFDFINNRHSEPLVIKPKVKEKFKKFVESNYVFTNEGSGLTVDYYFSRFDEVITNLNPEYATQHGIFFTDHNLSKFALWFVHNYFEKKLSDKYIVFDPAGGSGNLVTSWRGHLKHKIVSELQPDLLRTIERRMKLDSEEVQAGFTIIPKTSENVGLNFLNKSAEEYVSELIKELTLKNLSLDKPIAFLLNPPYKNTDENEKKRVKTDSVYEVHPSIIELTGNDASKERYLAFLGQILNISKLQMGHLQRTKLEFNKFYVPPVLDKSKVETPLLLIFTPTSWLIPRPTYINFREEFDLYFKYEQGFIILGNEFFKIKGRFPISFTIWSYKYNPKRNKNRIKVRDLTHLTKKDLEKNWNARIGDLTIDLNSYISKSKVVKFDISRGDIRHSLPKIKKDTKDIPHFQPMYDIKRDVTKYEKRNLSIIGGLPLNDPRRNNKKTYGLHNSEFVGLMDDITPVRIKKDRYNRLSQKPDRVWFRLDSAFADINKSVCVNAPTPVKSYCAYDFTSAKATFIWFSIAKSVNGRYPIWANQYDIWAPNVSKNIEKYFYSLCFAFGLSENRCVVTKFEKDNPVIGAPEVFVDNPLCPINPESFWATTIDNYIIKKPLLAYELVDSIKEFYKTWNNKYTKSGIIKNVGLEQEPYFTYFDYEDFLTPYSGLIQIKKFAEIHNELVLLKIYDEISQKTKAVREKIFKILVDDFKYFE